MTFNTRLLSKPYLLLLFLIAGGTTIVQAQSELEKKGGELLAKHKYEAAGKVFIEIFRDDPSSIVANFGMAKVMYQREQKMRRKEAANFKFLNLQEFFDILKESYRLAELSGSFYKELPFEQKAVIRRILQDTDDGIENLFKQKVSNEAFSLLTAAPYRKSSEVLYRSQIYDRYKDAELLEELRDALLRQCTDYLEYYPKMGNNNHYKVELYRKQLLKEYIQKDKLRQFGDKSGKMYEKYCPLILKHFSKTDLKHIVPEFYGAEYEFGKTSYNTKPNYLALKRLANSHDKSVIDYLCELNLHFEGYTPEKNEMYDEFIKTLAPLDVAFIAVQKKATEHINKQEWSKALSIYKNYAPLFPNMKTEFASIIGVLEDNTDLRQPVNLGATVNSKMKDYSPVISVDGQTLYFCRKNADTGEDVYVSFKKNGKWKEAVRLRGKVNTSSHEVPISLSADKSTLILFGNYSSLPKYSYLLSRESKLGKGDIYYSNQVQEGWGAIDVFPYPVNTTYYEAGLSMTSDGKAVLFCSDRKGVIGQHNPNYHPDYLYFHGSGEFNLDIFVCTKKGKDGWNEPINLGEVINTPFAEKNPFLHPDMKTLYFSSDGHGGLGGYDIYMSKRLDDTWTNWSEPINLGKVINSPYDDVFYIDGSGQQALIVSNKEGNSYGDLDIYEVRIPKKFQPDPIVVVSSNVTDNEGKPVTTDVYWEEKGNKENHGIVKTNPVDGGFTILLEPGKKYIYYANTNPYFSGSVEVDVTGKTTGVAIPKKKLTAISFNKKDSKHQPFVMKNLHFDNDSDVIRPESYFDLDRMADFIKKHADMKFGIEGHTDSNGSDASNLDLSRRRAQAVKRYLVEKRKVNGRLLSPQGYGETKPVASNDTEEGRQKNRRVEFTILEIME